MAQLIHEPPTLSRQLHRASSPLPLPPFAKQLPPTSWLKRLRRDMDGTLVLPGQEDYDARRMLYGKRFDPRPVAVALCRSEHDVRACLIGAQTNATPFRIRGGGHSFAGYSGGDGLIIDVAGLDDVVIDAVGLTATVGGGCPQGKFAPMLHPAGVYVPTGDWETVGIGGYMQGGGFSGTSRTYGLNSDNVISMRVMLADGGVVTASRAVNHDLWWAVRGGTGNTFGVVLEITYQLRPYPPVAALQIGFSLSGAGAERGVAALLAYQAGYMLKHAPDTLNSSAVIGQTNQGTIGEPWLVLEAVQVGTEAELQANLAPLLGLPGAVAGYNVMNLMAPEPEPPFSRTSRLVGRTITADEWRAMIALMARAPCTQNQMFIKAHGGAMNSAAAEDSAFVHRNAHCNLFLDVYWPTKDDFKAAEAFRTQWRAAVDAYWNGHIYQNFPEADAPDFPRNYWGRAYPALQAVKAKYDPTNAFTFPQAVRPASAAHVNWPPAVRTALGNPIVTTP